MLCRLKFRPASATGAGFFDNFESNIFRLPTTASGDVARPHPGTTRNGQLNLKSVFLRQPRGFTRAISRPNPTRRSQSDMLGLSTTEVRDDPTPRFHERGHVEVT